VFDVDLMISIDGVGGRMKFSHRPFKGIFNQLIIKLNHRPSRGRNNGAENSDYIFREWFPLGGWRKDLGSPLWLPARFLSLESDREENRIPCSIPIIRTR